MRRKTYKTADCGEATTIFAKLRHGYAARIRALRSARNRTQADLEKRIGGGIPHRSFRAWERGTAKPPRENIFELSRIFGVPLEQFWRKPTSSALRSQLNSPSPVSLVFVAIEARP
jgi:transcriptional regulator with XRE-family HTH domain